MIEQVLDGVTAVLLLSGAAFCMLGGYGLHRMPDFYTRAHAASLGDTLGAFLILAGLGLQCPSVVVFLKLVFTLGFLWFTGPMATHALVKAAYARGLAVEDAPRAD